MAIEVLGGLLHLTFSRPTQKYLEGDVPYSVLQVSIWGTLGTGAVAIISALFKRGVIQQASLKALAPDVLKASLICCATCTVIACYIIYKMIKADTAAPGNQDQLDAKQAVNRHLLFLEKAVSISGALGTGVAILARDFLNTSQSVKGLADHSIQPLLWISVTTLAFRLFHVSQKIK